MRGISGLHGCGDPEGACKDIMIPRPTALLNKQGMAFAGMGGLDKDGRRVGLRLYDLQICSSADGIKWRGGYSVLEARSS